MVRMKAVGLRCDLLNGVLQMLTSPGMCETGWFWWTFPDFRIGEFRLVDFSECDDFWVSVSLAVDPIRNETFHLFG